MKRKAGILLQILIILTAVVPAAPETADLERQYREAAAQLVCQCGCHEQLTVCAMQNCPSATPMRAEIREKLQAGIAVEKIVDGLVARIGKQALAAPTLKGFDLTAWIMPFAVFALGLMVVSWIVVRMARPASAAEPSAPVIVDPRVEKELKDFEEES
jgi:cytochrome c-type biogenesis protein CcmH